MGIILGITAEEVKIVETRRLAVYCCHHKIRDTLMDIYGLQKLCIA